MRAGIPPGASVLLQVYFANGRGHRKGGTGPGLKRVARAGSSRPFGNGIGFCVTFSAPTRPPLPKVVETGYKALVSTTSASWQARSAAAPGAGQWNKISFPLFVWERLQSGCTGWQLLLVQGQTIWPIPGELNHWVLQTSGVEDFLSLDGRGRGNGH